MTVDPTRPYLYALDRVNNELLFVNLDTLTLEESIYLGSGQLRKTEQVVLTGREGGPQHIQWAIHKVG